MYTPEQAYEFGLLTLCIWREARGESDAAKHAVGWTIRNRVNGKPWFGGSYCGVILKPKQFSSFNEGDPNASKIPNPQNDVSLQACLLAAKHVYEETTADPTRGAQYYYDDSIAMPPWASNMKLTAKIGKLNFYKEGA